VTEKSNEKPDSPPEREITYLVPQTERTLYYRKIRVPEGTTFEEIQQAIGVVKPTSLIRP
jgi:hypothetical protein